MKQILFILCVFFAFTSSAYATEYYKCVDQKGNTVLTTNPQEGMKCDMGERDSDQVLERKEREKAEEGIIKCTTFSTGGFHWRTCRDKNGKGKVVSHEQI